MLDDRQVQVKELTLNAVADKSGPSDPGIFSNPLSATMHSSLVLHICQSDKLTYMCLLYKLSASSIANGTSRASLLN